MDLKRLNIVTLGTKNLERSKAFFLQLFQWTPCKKDSDKIVFYDMGSWHFALYPWALLAEDAMVSSTGEGFSGITLAHKVRDKSEVSQLLEKAKALGGTILKPAQDVFWGGHSGYFKDLDGHLWEVA
ncbi:MAG TPA: glyoxalase [Bdellovibrionales bacterium]|nr:glyoxalase [Pseudobdellovibrionaceae bacterium]HAG92453.1 glyoxalase [Bdellovibrionales bacterium]|tara:strand:- start:6506 stop:6886 length:381 start_codon:yes stop_codon:yes gene_type:complete